jgi:hypothetical protein
MSTLKLMVLRCQDNLEATNTYPMPMAANGKDDVLVESVGDGHRNRIRV